MSEGRLENPVNTPGFYDHEFMTASKSLQSDSFTFSTGEAKNWILVVYKGLTRSSIHLIYTRESNFISVNF